MDALDGVYVDDDCCFLLVSCVGKNKWIVDIAKNYEDSDAGMIYRENNLLYLEINEKKINGFYDGLEKFVWDNGKKWNRLKITYSQFSQIRRKPYIPLTYIVFCIFRGFLDKIIMFIKRK